MKKIAIAIIAIFTAAVINVYVNAEEIGTASPAAIQTTQATTEPAVSVLPSSTTSTSIATTESAITESAITGTAAQPTTQKAGITPDNFFYPLERFVESVQVALTFSPEGKAQLMVQFANERLAEAQVMTEEKKLELVRKVMNDYIDTVNKANEEAQKAAQGSTNVTSVLNDIKLSEDSAGNTVITATGVIPQQYADTLKTEVARAVEKTAAIQTMDLVKDTVKKTQEVAKAAQQNLEAAEQTNDAAAIKAAQDKLTEAQQKSDQMIKDANAYRDSLKNQTEDQEKDQASMTEQARKLQEQIKKQQEKRNEMIEKLKGKPGKAAEKIKENTDRQIAKKLQRLQELTSGSSISDQTLSVNSDENKDQDQDEDSYSSSITNTSDTNVTAASDEKEVRNHGKSGSIKHGKGKAKGHGKK